MDVRCPQCSTRFDWSHPACPRCWRRNGRSPEMLTLKLLLLAAACALIAMVLKFAVAMTPDDVGKPPERSLRELLQTPQPPSSPDPVFRREG